MYNGLRDSTGLADGRRVLFFLLYFSQDQMVRSAHTVVVDSSRMNTPLQRSNKIKKRTTPRYKMEKKKKKSLAFSITFSVPGCVCVCHEIAAADVLFRLSSRRRVYNISAQDYFSKNTFIPC